MAGIRADGVGVRFVMALILVLATYNPSGYSYYHWVRDIIPQFTNITPYMAISGLALAIGWVIYLRATLRSIGIVGIVLCLAVAACIVWMLFEWGVLTLEYRRSLIWISLLFISICLTVGMCWSHIRRMMSGQVDADDVDE